MAKLRKKVKAKRGELRKLDFDKVPVRTQRDLSLLYRIGLSEGKDDEEIREGNDWSVETFEFAKQAFYKVEEAEVISSSNEKAYVDYITKQLGLIKDLNSFLKDEDFSRQLSAHVAGIKVKSDIYDKIIDRGLVLGFLKKQKGSLILEEELHLGDLANPELRERLRGELSELNLLMKKQNPMVRRGKKSKQLLSEPQIKRSLKLKRKIERSI